MLQKLNNHELNAKVKSLATEERKLTQNILHHLAEVDRRKLYLTMAFPSLFEYLVKEIGYSAGAAQRRIDAARLLQVIPEVSAKIESGAINLSQVSKLQQACRQAKKAGKKISVSLKREVLGKLEHQGTAATDLVLAQEFQLEIKAHDKVQIQRDESVRLEVTFSKEEMQLIRQAQDLLSNKTGGNLSQSIVEMARKVIRDSQPRKKSGNFAENVTSTVAVKVETRQSQKLSALKSLTPRLRRDVIFRDLRCQYVDSKSGKACGSKRFLHIDHIVPLFAGGLHEPENLRVLCSAHNIFRYRSDAGISAVASWERCF